MTESNNIDDTPLKQVTIDFTDDIDPVKTWTIGRVEGKLDKEKLDDIIIFMKYKTNEKK